MLTIFYANDSHPYDRGNYPRLRKGDLVRTHYDDRVWKVEMVWSSNRGTEQRVWLILQIKDLGDNYDESDIIKELE